MRRQHCKSNNTWAKTKAPKAPNNGKAKNKEAKQEKWRKNQPKKSIRVMDAVQKMADPAEQEGQATVDPADPAPNPTQRRKTLLTGITVDEPAKGKTDRGGRRLGLGHQLNS